MSDMKTVETDADVGAFLDAIEHKGRAEDCRAVADMMAQITGAEPRMWGSNIIGYGSYDYTRKDGSHHRFFVTGVSPRKANLTIYIMPGFSRYRDLLDQIGPHKTSVSCLYLGRLNRVDLDVLSTLISRSVDDMKSSYGTSL